MLNIEGLITKIRGIIEAEVGIKAYSPALPKEETDVCAVTYLGGTLENSLCGLEEIKHEFRVLIRGTQSDTQARAMADKVFNTLHLRSGDTFQENKIIMIHATSTPVYIGKDDDLNNLYNVLFTAVTN